ncbi:MAG: hypothetical protein WC549_00460 [Actinomycetota bacterium]
MTDSKTFYIKTYRRQKLDEALTIAGIATKSTAYMWLLAREREGRLTIPRDPVTKQRKLTLHQIQEIIDAFLPGGTGQWPTTFQAESMDEELMEELRK